MSLKQSIVVKSEFSVKRNGVGTRGSTPGQYLERYMARDDACDALCPVFGTPVSQYMDYYEERARKALEESNARDVTDKMTVNRDGVAFTTGNPSMSAGEVHRVSKRIQNDFDNGKTVLKTVLSFDDEYLKARNVVEPEFVSHFRGDHSGHVDQMKLRQAVTQGMSKLTASKRFDDLLWVGALQFDTMHVHAHLVAVDEGRGRMRPDGEQKGMLSTRDMRLLRDGVDEALIQMGPIRMFVSQVEADRSHARTTVRKYVYDALNHSSAPQLILASLPDDNRLWRASSQRLEMRRANDITRSYVSEILREPGSGYGEVLLDIEAYANARALREGLDDGERMRLVRRGIARLEEDCVNGVYDVLRTVKDSQRIISTPMLDLAAQEVIDLADSARDDPMAEFGFKMRSYAGRMQYHKRERKKYHDAMKDYESRSDTASEESHPALDFYRFEMQYQEQLMSKYQSLLGWYPYETGYEIEFAELKRGMQTLDAWEEMYHDKSLLRMTNADAEVYGKTKYGISGLSLLRGGSDILERRRLSIEQDVFRRADNVSFELGGIGRKLSWDVVRKDGVTTQAETLSDARKMVTRSFDDGVPCRCEVKSEPGVLYEFNDVKALDLHHLQYDFASDAPVSQRNVQIFTEAAFERERLMNGAFTYLYGTGQTDLAQELPIADVERMARYARELSGESPTVVSLRSTESFGGRRHARTISLDDNYDTGIRERIGDVLVSAPERFDRETTVYGGFDTV